MLGQLAEFEYKAKRISDWRVGGRASRLCRDNRPAISGLHPTARERHGREQWSTIELKLLFGYLNCRPGNIVVKYSRVRTKQSQTKQSQTKQSQIAKYSQTKQSQTK